MFIQSVDLNNLYQEAGLWSLYKKNIHAHERRHLLRNLSQERSIETGNQFSYREYTVEITC